MDTLSIMLFFYVRYHQTGVKHSFMLFFTYKSISLSYQKEEVYVFTLITPLRCIYQNRLSFYNLCTH